MTRVNLALERRRFLRIELSPGWILSAAILLLFLFFVVSPVISLYMVRSGMSTGRYLDEVAFAAIIPLILIAVLVSGRIYISPYIVWLLLFVTVGGISTWLGKVPLNVAAVGFLQAVKPAVIFILFQSIPLKRRHAETILHGFDIFFTWLPVFALLYLVIFEIMLGNNPLPAVNEATRSRLGIDPMRSFFPHANTFASMMVLCATWQFSWLVVKGERRRLLFLLIAALGILLTVRMKPMFGLPLCLLLIFILHRVRHGRISYRALLTGIGGAILVTILLLFLATRPSLRDVILARIGADTTSVRTVLLTTALELNVETRGLGVGFGRFGSPASALNFYSPLYELYGISELPGATIDNPTFITDQWWAWFLGEVGIVGMALFLLMLALILRFLYRVARTWHENAPALAVLAYATLGLLVYGIGTGATGAFLLEPPTTYYVMALAGLTYAMQRAYLRDGVVSTPEPS